MNMSFAAAPKVKNTAKARTPAPRMSGPPAAKLMPEVAEETWGDIHTGGTFIQLFSHTVIQPYRHNIKAPIQPYTKRPIQPIYPYNHTYKDIYIRVGCQRVTMLKF